MNFTFINDANLPTFGMCDISFDAGSTLESVVLHSLLSYARCEESELDGSDTKNGYWAEGGERFGSRMWLLRRAKINPQTPQLCEQYCRDALKWMVSSGVASSVDVFAEQIMDRINISVTINKNTTIIFNDIWSKI